MSDNLKAYMDNGAGKPVDPRVLDEMNLYHTEFYGNPASFHSKGFEALTALKTARERVSSLINADPKEIIFTSGSTEANNLALIGGVRRYKKRGTKVVISAVEHISVINITKKLTREGFTVQLCPVDEHGVIKLSELEKLVDDDTVMVSIMTANGEIGTIQPIKEAAEIAHSHEALFHTDATAAMGQIDLDVRHSDVDYMTLSSNDMYGPRGVGALYIKIGIRITPLMIGGGQEQGVRSGTENVAGIMAMSKAAEIAQEEMAEESGRLSELRDALIKGLLEVIPESYLNGHPMNRLPNNANIRYSFIEGEALIMSLDDVGVQLSSGSACAAKTLEPSHTLLACGLKHEEAHGSLVFTLGKNNNRRQVDYVIQEMPGIVHRLRAMSPLTPEELR
ncbi:cysteine desulfurase [Candidatus Bathyarchaeota archaeon]|nr:cysteine desulfurase [Candidatus Bathyarchaeota archaeon]MBT4319382.1 cysteine desulfurase [Candidatus Bathyarchaeota archaeon]MBT4424177.1 cysteine desulfurase [Candidatus Bathyarchaeota archaeon]MBT6604927.1 cysteine desulfurase [Candidatus Bathyarchaeota archaeon]MBT7187562.1 cysteine desulfurase [Candidatus Bathyarchaeota archaeon]